MLCFLSVFTKLCAIFLTFFVSFLSSDMFWQNFCCIYYFNILSAVRKSSTIKKHKRDRGTRTEILWGESFLGRTLLSRFAEDLLAVQVMAIV